MLAFLILLILCHWQTAFKKYQKHYTVIKTESEEYGEQRDSTFPRVLSHEREHLSESCATAEMEEKSLEFANRCVLTLCGKSGQEELSPFLRTEQVFETHSVDHI